MLDPMADALPAARPGPLSRLAPPLALMALIFLLSAQPDLSTGLGTWDLILRKGAHMAEFGLLWWLLWRATGHRHPLLAATATVLYGASDEWHQSFVEGRVGTPVDVLVDAAGVALAWVLSTRRRPARTQRIRV